MSSRIIVKNLPAYLTDEKLKKHFSQKGQVTDVKLKRGRDGRSRRFGFVGYKTEEEANEAVKFFDKSFLDTSQLVVELAKVLDDPTLISRRERKQLERQKRARLEELELENVRQHKRSKMSSATALIDEQLQNDPKFAQFVDAFETSKKKEKTWDNNNVDTVLMEQEQAKLHAQDESDDEYVNIIKDTNSGDSQNKPSDGQDDTPDNDAQGNGDASSDDEPMMPLSEVAEDGLAKDEAVSDLEWLQMRRQRMRELQNGNENESERENVAVEEKEGHDEKEYTNNKNVESEEQEEELPPPPPTEEEQTISKIESTRRLFLRNILFSSTESEFKDLFSRYGPVEEVHIPLNPKTSQSKGVAYVMFESPDDAVAAYQGLNKTFFQGRILHIVAGEPKKDGTKRLDEFDLKNMPLKRQTELRRKFAASKHQFAWNSLYLNTDAVMDTVAKRLGVSKSQLINPESSDSAVQQALAETSVINSIKDYFEANGVDLTLFGKSKEKSDTVILVKNLPFETSVADITGLFSEFGDLRKILLPPDGGIAMVVFKTAPQARAAFTRLAYRRFKSSILYLEKGPKGLLEGDEQADETSRAADSVGGVPVNVKETKLSSSEILGASNEHEGQNTTDVPQLPTTSLFIKNLDFKTTTQDLHNLFKPLEGYVVAQVKMKPDPKNAGKYLSMGFGFAEFRTPEQANSALKAMDGYVLQGHRLQIKISHRGGDQESKSIKPTGAASKTKIMVRNIPFEATKKDIQKLFGAFGQLRSVRLPKKFNKSARGFAFAEFVSAKEAENAIKALQGTHLLGRRLVMEYAQDDAVDAEEEISRMESRVKKQVTTQTLAGMRLSGQRKDMDMDEDENEF